MVFTYRFVPAKISMKKQGQVIAILGNDNLSRAEANDIAYYVALHISHTDILIIIIYKLSNNQKNMECELCGRNAHLVPTKIEGTILSVCDTCSNLGKKAEISVEIADRRQNRMDFNIIDPNFSKIIMSSRTKAGLSLEDLGKKINEKASVIERVEKGMRPTDALARKLEKSLKIKLLGYQED